MNHFLQSLLLFLHLQLQIIGELHLQGLSAGDQGQGTCQVLYDQVGCLKNPCPIEIEGEVLEYKLSRCDEGNGHGTVDNRREDLNYGLGYGIGEDLSQVFFLLLRERFLA